MRRSNWIWLAAAIAVLLVGAAGFIGWRLSPMVRDRLVDALGQRLESQVALESLRVVWAPHLGIRGEGLVIRHHGRTDVPPLIEIKSFSADATLFGLILQSFRLRTVRVVGLHIRIPPHQDDAQSGDGSGDKGGGRGDGGKNGGGDSKTARTFTIDHLEAEDARLEILPKEQNKSPRVFAIHHLQLESIGLQQQATFHGVLTNPTPRGEIDTHGTIGPWTANDPGATPLGGTYTFAHADLGTIKGIGGILESTGTFSGLLNRIDVQGETRTPDFTIAKAGNPVPLTTKFQAVVDGTNGDTILSHIDATLNKSAMQVKGAVIDMKDADGHDIKVHVVMDDGRIEDLLRLSVKSDEPIMTGSIDLQADLEIPPGEPDVIDKMRLQGRFGIDRTKFTKGGIQQKIEALSQRAQGKTEGEPEDVLSNLRGAFIMAEGVIRFSQLEFDIPGAALKLAGTYGIRREQFDLKGEVRLQAKLSETVTGYKSFLLKLIDPLFRNKKQNAGAIIPIKITGTRKDPKFGLDTGRVLGG